MPASPRAKRIHVAVTGASGALGQLVLPHLLASRRVGRVVAVDLTPPSADGERLRSTVLDLTRPDAGDQLADLFLAEEVGAVLHLAFFSREVRDPAYAHEVESLGTSHVLLGAARARVRSLVVPGSTLVYGASPQNPNYLTEDRPLPAGPRSRFVADKVEVEHQLARYRKSHPELESVVLRFAPIVGPSIDNPFTRFLGRRLAPTVMGYDPLVQCIHEEDAVSALLAALWSGRSGPYNVVGRGVLPLSVVLRLVGAWRFPLPAPLSHAALEALNATGLISAPPSLVDYLRFLWVADGRRAERDLGFKPRHSCREAILSFAKARSQGATA